MNRLKVEPSFTELLTLILPPIRYKSLDCKSRDTALTVRPCGEIRIKDPVDFLLRNAIADIRNVNANHAWRCRMFWTLPCDLPERSMQAPRSTHSEGRIVEQVQERLIKTVNLQRDDQVLSNPSSTLVVTEFLTKTRCDSQASENTFRKFSVTVCFWFGTE